MSKFLLSFTLLILIATTSFAQKNDFVVHVRDSLSNIGIPNVSYSIQSNDKQLLLGKADTSGTISCTSPAEPGLTIIISAVGYKTIKTQLTNEMTVLMNRAVITLDEVVLKSKRELQFKPGKILLNISNDQIATSNNVLELLRNMPMISVNPSEGTIYYKGKTGVTILIDGKPASGDLLKTLKPSAIKQVQLLSSSSAKYSSESKNGILNLITAKKDVDGYDFSFDAIGGTRQRAYLSPSIVIQKGSLNALLNIAYDHRTLTSDQLNTNVFPLSSEFDRQYIHNNQAYKSLYFNSSYAFTNRKELSLVVNYYGYHFNKTINDHYTRLFKNNLPDSLQLLNQNRSQKNGLDASLDYIYKFPGKNDGSLTFSAQISNLYNPQDAFISSLDSGTSFKTHNKPVDREYTLQADYERPLDSIASLETGIKYILRDNNSVYNSTAYSNSSNLFDLRNQGGVFSYTQNILGAFAQTSWDLKAYSFGLGLRAEIYKYDYNQGTTVTNVSLFPNLNFTKKLSKNYFISFDYSRKIQRPGSFYLTNFLDQSAININTQGNSGLKYQYLNNFSVGTNLPFKTIPLYLSLDYNLYNNGISDYSYYVLNANNSETIVTTFVNLFHHNDISLALNARLTGINKVKSNLNVSITHSYFGYGSIARTGNEFLIAESNVFSFEKGFAVNTAVTYKSHSTTLQGFAPNFTITSVSFAKHFEKPDLSVGIGIDNVFNIGQKANSSIQGENVTSMSSSKTYRDIYYLKVSYDLTKNTVKPSHHAKISNDDLKN